MGTVRIIAGSLKGRMVPLSRSVYKNAEITTQKVKGAFFSTIGDSLADMSFCDLFGGSGQMGFEALSRGAAQVVINEKERARFESIQGFTRSLPDDSNLVLMNRPALSALRHCEELGFSFDCVYLDPPYVKARGETYRYTEVLEALQQGRLLREGGVVAVQHFGSSVLPGQVGALAMFDHRVYGSTALSYYGRS
jgi:16S rRNA (guanine966-N2)-methyltransferase